MLISVSVQSFDDNSSQHLFSLGMTVAIKENIPKLLIKSVSFVTYKRVWKPRQALVDPWRMTLLTSKIISLKFLSLTLRCSAGVRICSGSIPREGTTSPQTCETADPKPVTAALCPAVPVDPGPGPPQRWSFRGIRRKIPWKAIPARGL